MDDTNLLTPYCNLMAWIKARIDVMHKLMADPHGLPVWAVAEITQLEIRMISETLALGCLLVHGDVQGTRTGKLIKAYQADVIMNAIEKLWTAAGSVDTRLNESRLHFELHGT